MTPLTHGGGIAAGVFLVQYTLYYKKSKELQLAHPAFPQGGPENISQYLQHKLSPVMSQYTISVAVNDVLLTQLTTLNNVQLSQDSQQHI